MVRIRRHQSGVTGSFTLAGGGAFSSAAKTNRKKTFGLAGGGAVTAAGSKSIPTSGGTVISVETAAILLKQGMTTPSDPGTDNWSKADDFKAHIQHYGGDPRVMRHSKLYSNSGVNSQEDPWGQGVPQALVDGHTAAVNAGNTALADKYARTPLVFCFKSYNSAQVRAHMNAIPSWLTEVEYCYQQEMDAKPWPVLDYLNVYAQMEADRLASPNAAKIYLLKNGTWQNQIFRRPAGFLMEDYWGIGQTWTGQTSPSTTGQNYPHMRFGPDIYNQPQFSNQQGYYMDMTECLTTNNWVGGSSLSWMGIVNKIRNASGYEVPWVVPEWGAILPELPPTGPYYTETSTITTGSPVFASPPYGANGTPNTTRKNVPPGNNPDANGRLKGDFPSGIRHTAWIADCINVFNQLGAQRAVYWCANGTAGNPTKYYHLDIGHNTAAPQWIDHAFPDAMALITANIGG